MKHEMFDDIQSQDRTKRKKVKVTVKPVEKWDVTEKGQLVVRKIFPRGGFWDQFVTNLKENILDFDDMYDLFIKVLVYSVVGLFCAGVFAAAWINLETFKAFAMATLAWWGLTLVCTYVFMDGTRWYTNKDKIQAWMAFHLFGALFTAYGFGVYYILKFIYTLF